MSAGHTPGVPRLGVPALLISDASLGITNPGYRLVTQPRCCLGASRWARASIARWCARPALPSWHLDGEIWAVYFEH
jgi:hypothetical protein